jgi:hypothetical protein
MNKWGGCGRKRSQDIPRWIFNVSFVPCCVVSSRFSIPFPHYEYIPKRKSVFRISTVLRIVLHPSFLKINCVHSNEVAYVLRYYRYRYIFSLTGEMLLPLRIKMAALPAYCYTEFVVSSPDETYLIVWRQPTVHVPLMNFVNNVNHNRAF